ncbi:hypothetical protein POF50_029290 [Streptomyces sp. SL13]|jgi:hypothetical protein|uniref:Uncharacterized protein n=1 Tax=Streptantibioticus silvisoli TaxID=2705255 RepID=A0AA90KBJ2_9ACTN|nr:hypothetical protein [Streptantibioticus silvisoli]MDI5961838.1 hypothetical protein [Streptantibioticus silvisoli]MDI5973392.1 hypothetical protein [Streptantibioticus silvisoli]
MDTTNTETPVDSDEKPVMDGAVSTPAEDGAVSTTAEDGAEVTEAPADVEEEAAEAELASRSQAKARSSVVASGAAGLVALGLALASVTGTWLGTIMSEREQLIGQISAQSHPTANQIALEFGTPWHTTEVFNGVFALVALLVAAVVLISQTGVDRPASATVPWIRAVAWGALILGVIGLVVAGLMYFDVFTALPHVPAAATSSAPTG